MVRKFRRWAGDRFPLLFPVRIYLRPRSQMDQMLGFFELSDSMESGIIAVCDDLSRELMLDTLIEEYAHARTAWLNDEEEDSEDPYHHASFWAEYGRIQKAARAIHW